ncbi:MAG TPA: pyridoxine 5'-phosphate synthase, partial [Bauldia sp.]|nr:pyridoxine 5'-phosphate synthase [Bauldia sp.]
MPCHLSVNLNAVAMLRNRRNLPWPSVVDIGRIALDAGAHGLTVHPRPDERHIRRTDVPELAAVIAREFPGREFNIEGNPDARFVELVESVKPAQVTLVPDDIRQATSDHGWNIAAHRTFLKDIVARLKSGGM